LSLGQGRRRANKKIVARKLEAFGFERGGISERTTDVHAAREGFLLRREVA
jgi:hypothetical protein